MKGNIFVICPKECCSEVNLSFCLLQLGYGHGATGLTPALKLLHTGENPQTGKMSNISSSRYKLWYQLLSRNQVPATELPTSKGKSDGQVPGM